MGKSPPTNTQIMRLSSYLLISFGLVILVISIWAMIQALSYYESGKFTQFFVYGIMASVGTVFALRSMKQTQRRMNAQKTLAPKARSTVVCTNCGWQITRTSNLDDYIGKEVGRCQHCEGIVRITPYKHEEFPKGSRSSGLYGEKIGNEKACVKCSMSLPKDANFCDYCGTKQRTHN